MKKISVYSLIYIFICSANAQWEWQNPLPQGNPLNDVLFINDNEGWAVGNYGTVLYTIDGGDNWQLQESGTTGLLKRVCFTDSQHGWIAGEESNALFSPGEPGFILHTSNGGAYWEEQLYLDDHRLVDVFFINPDHGWALAQGNTWGYGDYLILYSNNGGQDWAIQSSDTLEWLNDIVFINQQEGWAVGSIVLHTFDGGNNWIEQENVSGTPLGIVDFIDSDNGWAISSWVYSPGKLIETNDGGSTWEIKYEGEFIFKGLEFVSSEIGWISGRYGEIIHTENGGTTWTEQTSGTSNFLGNIYALNSDEVFISGPGVLKTMNGGNDWEHMFYGTFEDLKNVYFTDEFNGWAVGDAGTIVHTSDGGTNWYLQSSGVGCSLVDLCFSDISHGWAVGTFDNLVTTVDSCVILNTINEGNTWSVQYSDTGFFLTSLTFIDHENGWVVGSNGTILHTSNGGGTWVAQNSTTTKDLRKICFTDENHGWILASNLFSSEPTVLLKTQDGGITWEVEEDWEMRCEDMFFIDSLHGWVLHRVPNIPPMIQPSTIYRTIDGGATWDSIGIFGDSTGCYGWMNAIYFTDINHGWAAGYHSIIFTEDGGTTWSRQSNVTRNGLHGIYFSDVNNGWIVGNYGTILHTDNGGIMGVIKKQMSECSLIVFPNPSSNGSITISIDNDLPKNRKLACFNLFGQQVHQQEIHSAETVINVSTWTPGIYLAVVYEDGKPVGRSKFVVR